FPKARTPRTRSQSSSDIENDTTITHLGCSRRGRLCSESGTNWCHEMQRTALSSPSTTAAHPLLSTFKERVEVARRTSFMRGDHQMRLLAPSLWVRRAEYGLL